MTTPNTTPEEFQLDQMEVFGDMIQAFQKSVTLISNLSDCLVLLNFQDNNTVQSFYNAMAGYVEGTTRLRDAFKSYAESHSLNITEPDIPGC